MGTNLDFYFCSIKKKDQIGKNPLSCRRPLSDPTASSGLVRGARRFWWHLRLCVYSAVFICGFCGNWRISSHSSAAAVKICWTAEFQSFLTPISPAPDQEEFINKLKWKGSRGTLSGSSARDYWDPAPSRGASLIQHHSRTQLWCGWATTSFLLIIFISDSEKHCSHNALCGFTGIITAVTISLIGECVDLM